MRRKRTLRYLVVASNALLLIIVSLIIFSSSSGQAANQPLPAITTPNSNVSNPLDQLSSADIAVSIANMTYLPEATAVKDQAETVQAELAIAPAANIVQSKPQVVATALKSNKDIINYVTVSGDTVAAIAAKYNITSNSIIWSNHLNSNLLQAGLKLLIPPINGIVYTVKAGDTPQSLAAAYSANASQISSFNNAEVSGLIPGQLIIIPNGQQPATQAFGAASFGSGGSFYPSYGANGYDFGYCTWYVATQIPVPSNWGNASSWSYYAALSGWTVRSTPSVGAIAQTPYAAGGQGHVGIVRGVSSDGSQVLIQDMNGIAGWDRVGEAWESTATYPHYITH